MVGDDDPCTPDLDSALGIGSGHNAFEAELTVPCPHHLGHIVPVHGRVKHFREITADRERAAAHVDVLLKLGQPEPLVSGVVDAPHRPYLELKHSSERQPERYGKAGAQIAFAVAASYCVHS